MKPTVQQSKMSDPVKEAIKPILYADIFDYPLTFEEVYRFLEFKTTQAALRGLLDEAVARREIIQVEGFYSLAGKPHLVMRRRERWAIAQALWPKACHYGRWMASLPFVRMVAVTGALAVENPRDDVDDIDYLIVTRPGRLWLCRAIIILMVRYGHLRGVHLCPNYMLTERLLQFENDNLFIAREMLQMVPLYGKQCYLDMRHRNDWVTDYLPQGTTLNLDKLEERLPAFYRFFKRSSEFVLGGFVGDWLEKPLQTYQINKHTRLAEKYDALDKVAFDADQCKGHYDSHNGKTMNAYQGRVDKYKQTAASGT